MKKKAMIIVLALLLVVSCGILVACGGKHSHSYGTWKTVTPPTCSEEGSRKHTCSGCGDVVTEAIERLEHTFSGWKWHEEKGKIFNANKCVVCHTIDIKVEVTDGLEYSFDGDNATVIGIGEATSSKIVIPCVTKDGKIVTAISNRAFFGCGGLAKITIPSGVTSIGERAFEGCRGLTNITFADSNLVIITFTSDSELTSTSSELKNIGEFAFDGCSSLKSINIPSGVTSIGDGAFNDCDKLVSVTIPSGVTGIGARVFSGCSGLKSIAIPSGVTSIGSSSFFGCTGLTGKLVIPSSVTNIGESAFYNCSGLTGIIFAGSSELASIGNLSFSGCNGLTDIIISKEVISIGEDAFGRCSKLTIYCEAESKPDGWNDNWNIDNRPVEWGYKG